MHKIEIQVSDSLILDAGTITESADQFTIQSPTTPMFEQLLTYLDGQPYSRSSLNTPQINVGFTALCIRWGSYLATLLDPEADKHPDLSLYDHSRPDAYSWIINTEMKRLNLEISFNIQRLGQIYRERGTRGFYELLAKAYTALPMPHKSKRKNRQTTDYIIEALFTGSKIVQWRLASADKEQGAGEMNGAQENEAQPVAPVETKYADRFLANALTNLAWRNTDWVENLHRGPRTPHPLTPHQQRFKRVARLALMRNITARMGGVAFMMGPLFDPNDPLNEFDPWPGTATTIKYAYESFAPMGWSLTNSSSVVVLPKEA